MKTENLRMKNTKRKSCHDSGRIFVLERKSYLDRIAQGGANELQGVHYSCWGSQRVYTLRHKSFLLNALAL